MTNDQQPQQEPSQRFRTETMEDARQAVETLLKEARYRVDILSPHLDPRLFDQAPVTESLRRVIVEGRHRSRIRILVADPESVVQRGHRLLNLARHLTSQMEIRQLSLDDQLDPPTWLIVDQDSYARWDPDAGYDGLVAHHDRGQAARLERAFNELWNRSQPSPDLRRLFI